MKKTKTLKRSIINIIAIFLFLGLLLGLRWSWSGIFPAPESPGIVDGVLDLRGWDLQHSPSISLNGQWRFYPNKLYTYNDKGRDTDDATLLQVPGDWRNALAHESGSSLGYGTYELRILTDPFDQPVSIWAKEIEASSVMEINGFMEGMIGVPADNADNYEPRRISYTITYTERSQQEIVILIRVANFDNPYKGGILYPVQFGSQAAIDYERWYSIGFQLITFVVLLLHGLYSFILYLFNRRERSLLIFSVLASLAGVAVVADHDNVLMLWLPINYAWSMKISMLAYLWVTFLIFYSLRKFSTIRQWSRWDAVYTAVLIIYSVFVLLAVPSLLHATIYLNFFALLYMWPIGWSIYFAIHMYVTNRYGEGTIFLVLSAVAVISNSIWGLFNHVVYYPVDIIAAIICFCAFWFKQYMNNVQENLKLNDRLREADKLKDQFLTNTSHELRTPLHGIMNIAETVLNKEAPQLSEKSRKDMELLVTISRRMSSLLVDLLDAVMLKEHRVKLNSKPLLIQSIIPGVINMLGFLHENKPLRITVKIDQAMPAVMADEKRLVQILYNLLHNAIKFTDKGEIIIAAEQRGKSAWIHVSDTGSGMDQETLAKIFLPYEQGSNGLNDGRGVGLGLTICKQLVELHGGTLTVLSKPGEGTVFGFSLALADAEAASSAQSIYSTDRDAKLVQSFHSAGENSMQAQFDMDLPPAKWADQSDTASMEGTQPAAKTVIHILAVDDDPVNLNVLKSILSTEAYEITLVNSADKALQLLNSEQWDLLIADVMMPHMSGYDLTRKVREQYSLSELPVLLLTARTQPSDIYAGFLAGANDYVTKPVDGLELKYRIRALTGLKQSINALLRMEAAYLQAQIQPHFIFNTLNSIMALSIVDVEKMVKLGDAFANYLRISFDFVNTKQLVSFAHELELVKAYLYVEQERFRDRLSVVWEMEVDNQLLLPPLTIQPLVENAVRHGLMSRAKGGTVVIRAVRKEDSILVEVKDNGKGIDQAMIEHLLQEPNQSKSGIGLYNTNRRLLQLCGQGLSIESIAEQGTTVSFVIPLKHTMKNMK